MNICHIDSHSDAIGPAFTIIYGDSHRISIFCFIVKRCICSQLSCRAIHTERHCVCAPQTIAQIIVIRIRRGNWTADVYARTGVFCDSPCYALSTKHWGTVWKCLIYICHIYRDRYAITPASTIRHGNGHRIGIFCFIVKRCICSQLSCRAINTKRRRIRSPKTIGQRIFIHICSSNSSTNIHTAPRIFCYGTGCAGTCCEHRRTVFCPVSNVDRNVNRGSLCAVRNRDRDGISRFRLIIKSCFCAELPVCAIHTECRSICTTKTISECVSVRIGRSDSPPNIFTRSRPLKHSSRRARSLSKNGWIVCRLDLFLPCRYLIRHIGNTNDNRNRRCKLAIRYSNRNRVAVFRFIVQCSFRPQLPRGAHKAKQGRIRATKTIGQRIIIRICGRHNFTYIFIGSRILSDRPRRARTFTKHWRAVLIYVNDND